MNPELQYLDPDWKVNLRAAALKELQRRAVAQQQREADEVLKDLARRENEIQKVPA